MPFNHNKPLNAQLYTIIKTEWIKFMTTSINIGQTKHGEDFECFTGPTRTHKNEFDELHEILNASDI